MSDLLSNEEEKELKAKSFIYAQCGNSTLNIPKILIRNIGLNAAAFLESLISKEKYFSEKNMLTNDGYFWNTENDRQDDCGLTPYQQTQAITLLENLGILFPVIRRGTPAKQHFKISYKKFEDKFSNFLELDIKNLRTILIRISNKNKEVLSKDNSKETEVSFYQVIVPRKTRRKEVERKETPQIFIPDQSPPQKKIWIEQLNWKYLVVQEWNKIPQSFFHSHHKNMTTSLICQVAKYLEYLAQGVFFNQCNLDPDFIKKNHIPNSWITNNKKFTQREILNAIKGFSLYCQDGYWPVNKKYLPKSLLTFIYNENFETKTTTSYLLSLIANPEVKSFEEQKRLEDFNPQYTKYFIQRNLLRFFAEGDLPTVYRGIAGIETRIFRDQVFNFNGGGTPKLKEVIGEGPGKLEPMFDNYAQYLNNYNRLEPEKMFVQYKGYFQDFLESLKQHYSSFEVNI